MNDMEQRSIRYMFEKYVSIACPKTVLTRSQSADYITLYALARNKYMRICPGHSTFKEHQIIPAELQRPLTPDAPVDVRMLFGFDETMRPSM